MDPLANGLQDLDVQRCSTPVVPIILVFTVTSDATSPFTSSESQCRLAGDAGYDCMRVEGENGGVHIDGILPK